MGMTRKETLQTRYGEFMDQMACDAITKGTASYKRQRKRMGFDDLLKVR